MENVRKNHPAFDKGTARLPFATLSKKLITVKKING
jgi:hypothetical protein